MPKVDPQSGEPMSDDPGGSDEYRGGKTPGDPALEKATETGGSSPSRPWQRGGASGQSSGERGGEQGATGH